MPSEAWSAPLRPSTPSSKTASSRSSGPVPRRATSRPSSGCGAADWTALSRWPYRRLHSPLSRPSTAEMLAAEGSSRACGSAPVQSRMRAGTGWSGNTSRRAVRRSSLAASTLRSPAEEPATRRGIWVVIRLVLGKGARMSPCRVSLCQVTLIFRWATSCSPVSTSVRPSRVSRSLATRTGPSVRTTSSSRIGPAPERTVQPRMIALRPCGTQPSSPPRTGVASGPAIAGMPFRDSAISSPRASRESTARASWALDLPTPDGPCSRVSGERARVVRR